MTSSPLSRSPATTGPLAVAAILEHLTPLEEPPSGSSTRDLFLAAIRPGLLGNVETMFEARAPGRQNFLWSNYNVATIATQALDFDDICSDLHDVVNSCPASLWSGYIFPAGKSLDKCGCKKSSSSSPSPSSSSGTCAHAGCSAPTTKGRYGTYFKFCSTHKALTSIHTTQTGSDGTGKVWIKRMGQPGCNMHTKVDDTALADIKKAIIGT
ncbi:hypothetical protein Q9L58_009667 [Maublancomyces gigas]|uniref:Uncharacterized protein n=1 Tax=Discina gigas TaxID=1032678 RepID=A0ABR3G693_9PEZI